MTSHAEEIERVKMMIERDEWVDALAALDALKASLAEGSAVCDTEIDQRVFETPKESRSLKVSALRLVIAQLRTDRHDSLADELNDAVDWLLADDRSLLAENAALRGRVEQAEKALYEIVGESYNLITQGESPTQRRQPSAQRIYDIAKAARAAVSAAPEGER